MKKQKHDGGFVAMSVGAGLLIVLVMASLAARYMGDYLKSREWQVVAMQTNRFTQAVSSYVGKFYPTVLASATITTPAVVTTQMLKNTGLLPASFSETNSYGQQYQAMIVRNQQNQELLQGMVVSRGGHAMPFTALSQISKDITAGFGGYVEDGQTAVGAMRSWRIPLSSYGTSTGRGHLAVMLSTDDLLGAREDGDRLYRFQVNGRPDLNKMHTAIDMGGNNLNSVGTVTASNVAGQNGNFGVSLVSNGPITAGGDIRSTGGWIVTRSGKGWMDETHGGGLYMSDNDWLRILNNKGFYTGGEIRGGKIRSDGDVSAGGILTLDKINVAGTACPVNGAISRDTAGATLSCQSGIWVSGQNRFTTQLYDIGQNVNAQYIGIHAYCSWTHLFSAPLGGRQRVYNVGNAWYVTNTPYGGFQTGSTVSVTCLNLPGAGLYS
ncbi:shufflon system plasmid conjugative transfer pilus tip adhesin PilV [Salmonella enterica]|uniref:Shufflon protein B n=17 Tax=Salmonella enterica TaxID=28901 RepID=A0A5V6DDH5_SALET|nr:shufflon system plasmid conjugative transfer pilus tip adhesin PilV [Salmonella enterica]EAA5621041.1 Shufflon protein B [Salmonella enterica subsp. enterica serovar Tennessee]EBG9515509.1 shufflon system plasmid conjugative transfer pilus tip adhesin PilV [Salmonella enterica subsp. enterica serovar Gaminara]EBQ9599229.1 Shufflon protein B [Salmonella enterica subsp. enterica serovar Carmel]ECC3369585.1 shufflon system plasmid conjugative transfer pilus tip adhesin PilV [Salmonella enterica